MIGYANKPSAVDSSTELVIAPGDTGSTGKGSNTAWFNNITSPYFSGNSSSWSTTSDSRLKKNIVDNNAGLETIKQLQVRNFEYRTEAEIDENELDPAQRVKVEGTQLGFIAQEIQTILPEWVTEESTGVLSINEGDLTYYLVNAIKELSAENEALSARILTLENA